MAKSGGTAIATSEAQKLFDQIREIHTQQRCTADRVEALQRSVETISALIRVQAVHEERIAQASRELSELWRKQDVISTKLAEIGVKVAATEERSQRTEKALAQSPALMTLALGLITAASAAVWALINK